MAKRRRTPDSVATTVDDEEDGASDVLLMQSDLDEDLDLQDGEFVIFDEPSYLPGLSPDERRELEERPPPPPGTPFWPPEIDDSFDIT